MIRAATTAATIARITDEPMLKNKLAAIVIGCPPVRAMDSFVISVSIASIGVGMRLTVKRQATPANAAASPTSG